MSLPPFQTLVDEHSVALQRYLRAVVGAADAPDCFQETMLSALRAYPKLERGENLAGWLFRIAHNKAIDHHRRRGRDSVPLAVCAAAAMADLTPPEETPWDETLWDAVRDLPPRQRSAIVLRHVGGMSYREIAEVMGCTEGAARQNAHHGLGKLRKAVVR